ncbi:hypothetical protein CRM22_005475 [Opisthorchis felineus]|uniref:Secreted protein n=1 Tax=Opisthorchis felineus TaxID=147828 RepID=A0A4S2LQZ0_OPIFE|nr:hypothetical protein CRM22_005475 [Opisthorchis felineus]
MPHFHYWLFFCLIVCSFGRAPGFHFENDVELFLLYLIVYCTKQFLVFCSDIRHRILGTCSEVEDNRSDDRFLLNLQNIKISEILIRRIDQTNFGGDYSSRL